MQLESDVLVKLYVMLYTGCDFFSFQLKNKFGKQK